MNFQFREAESLVARLSIIHTSKNKDDWIKFENVVQLLDLYREFNSEDRIKLFENAGEKEFKRLMSFSAIFAEEAMATGSLKLVEDAVLSCSIKWIGTNHDSLMNLIFAEHACRYLEQDFESLCLGMSTLLTTHSHRGLTKYLGRSPFSNRIDNFGVEVISDQSGRLRFRAIDQFGV